MRHIGANIRLYNFTFAIGWNRSLKQIIIWIGKREHLGLGVRRWLDIQIFDWRWPKLIVKKYQKPVTGPL